MKRILPTVCAAALLACASQASAINCEQVKRYLTTGRTVEQIAETMIVSVDEVKKCAEAVEKEKAAKPEEEKKAE
jgi:hypothetical protein